MARSTIAAAIAFLLLMALLSWAGVEWLPQTAYYPRLMISPAKGLSIEFLMPGFEDQPACETQLIAMKRTLTETCLNCIVEAQCRRGLTERHRLALGDGSLPLVSMRIGDGAILFKAERVSDAMMICAETRRHISSPNTLAISCVPPGMPRPRLS